MQTKRQDVFATIRTEGSILPPDLLLRVADESNEIPGLTPSDYHLAGERINESVSRSWNRLQGAWVAFRQASQNLPSQDVGTTLTRERWLLPLFQELGYGRLQASKSVEINGKTYAISHLWQQAPIHLVSFRIDLDKRTAGVAGASRSSPHSLVQELLNHEGAYLWGFVSNGLRLRILRDNKSITRQAFVEFDLQAMMDGQVYPDFKLLWLLCHQSRVEGDRLEQCWLEKWSQTAIKQGTRALDGLRDGVQRAIEAIGRGFLAHSANRTLRDRLQVGTLDKQDYYRQLLRLIYRLLFLFVAEDRGLLFDPRSDAKARDRYSRFYSTQRLRELAGRSRGTQHADLYESLAVVFSKLDQSGCPELGLPAFGSFLWSETAISQLVRCQLANRDLLDAIRELAYALDGQARRPVDYRNLGAEELGSIYESLLELYPQINADSGTFSLTTAAGHERKTTGSYYTPTSLVNCLLDSALEPVLADAIKGGAGHKNRGDTAEVRILSLKVCDPACGSGHFLIAAAHRIAKRLASVRTGDEEPSPDATRHALRDVIGHCIYGVDLNPMAVELCKVSLWMEALEPGKPLSFLDHRIQRGNSLIGTTPALLTKGIPDEAFEPIEGDDKGYCRESKKQNKDERKGQGILFGRESAPWLQLGNFAASVISRLDALPDDAVGDIRSREQQYAALVTSSTYESGRLLADTWCAAFVWKKTKEFDYPITEKVFRDIERNPHSIPPWMKQEITRLTKQYQFFHWHLAYPDVFKPIAELAETDVVGWSGGFDIVLGNPPWERIKLQEKEWFADRVPGIANAPNAAQRRQLIDALAKDDPALYAAFLDDRRKSEGESSLARESGRYPLCGRGDVNTYTLFAEGMRHIRSASGRVGVIVPSGIATDDTTKFFFRDLIDTTMLVSLYDFENREGIFPAVDSRYKFCLLTLGHATDPAKFAFFLQGTDDLADPHRPFILSAEDIVLLNPNSRTCPIFRSNRDAEITKAICRRMPVLTKTAADETLAVNPWGFDYMTKMFDMADSSHEFIDWSALQSAAFQREDATIFDVNGRPFSPLYEAKHIHLFDHRWGLAIDNTDADIDPTSSLAGHQQPDVSLTTRYWVPRERVDQRLRSKNWKNQWLMGWRDITNVTNERTVIAGVFPRVAAAHTLRVAFLREKAPIAACFIACLSSFALDFVARQKTGGTHLTVETLLQLPVVGPSVLSGDIGKFILPRVLELAYTAWDLQPFASDCGYTGPPFVWNEQRRFQLRCELDAAFFHLYGISRDDTDYIMETFPIVRRKDIDKYGCYRTKENILEIYNTMAEATRAPLSIEEGMAVLQALALLHTWGKPADRRSFELGMLLLQLDDLRQRIIKQQRPIKARASGLPPASVGRLDEFIGELVGSNTLRIDNRQNRQLVALGSAAPARDSLLQNAAGKTVFAKAQEAIQALEALNQLGQSLDLYMGADEYGAIEIAIS